MMLEHYVFRQYDLYRIGCVDRLVWKLQKRVGKYVRQLPGILLLHCLMIFFLNEYGCVKVDSVVSFYMILY
jgi:hypothetical protein